MVISTCTIHCHPKGTGNEICCNKSSGVDGGRDKGGTLTAEHLVDGQDDDSEVE